MSNITRRQFLEDSILAAAAAAAASIPTPTLAAAEQRAVSANDKITVAIIGCGIRGKQHASELARFADCEIAYVCDPDRDRAAEVAARLVAKNRPPAEGRSGFARDSRRQVRRRRLHCDAQPLARAGGHLGHAGGQGRLCRKAGQPQHQRRPPHRAGGAQARPHLPGRNAEPLQRRAG